MSNLQDNKHSTLSSLAGEGGALPDLEYDYLDFVETGHRGDMWHLVFDLLGIAPGHRNDRAMLFFDYHGIARTYTDHGVTNFYTINDRWRLFWASLAALPANALMANGVGLEANGIQITVN